MFAHGILMATAILMIGPPARADQVSDCNQLAEHFKIQVSDRANFNPFCFAFHARCLKIEDEASEACGAESPRSRQIKSMMDAVSGFKTESAVQRGDLTLKACGRAQPLRKEQIDTCNKLAPKCRAAVETFTGKTGQKAELKCDYIRSEANAWSTEARGKKMCNTIDTDLKKCQDAAAAEASACTDISNQVDAHSGRTRDERAANATRTSPSPNPASAPEDLKATPASVTQGAGNTPAWAREPQVDSKMQFDYPGRQCGICGCVKNGAGKYNPIVGCISN